MPVPNPHRCLPDPHGQPIRRERHGLFGVPQRDDARSGRRQRHLLDRERLLDPERQQRTCGLGIGRGVRGPRRHPAQPRRARRLCACLERRERHDHPERLRDAARRHRQLPARRGRLRRRLRLRRRQLSTQQQRAHEHAQSRQQLLQQLDHPVRHALQRQEPRLRQSTRLRHRSHQREWRARERRDQCHATAHELAG